MKAQIKQMTFRNTDKAGIVICTLLFALLPKMTFAKISRDDRKTMKQLTHEYQQEILKQADQRNQHLEVIELSIKDKRHQIHKIRRYHDKINKIYQSPQLPSSSKIVKLEKKILTVSNHLTEIQQKLGAIHSELSHVTEDIYVLNRRKEIIDTALSSKGKKLKLAIREEYKKALKQLTQVRDPDAETKLLIVALEEILTTSDSPKDSDTSHRIHSPAHSSLTRSQKRRSKGNLVQCDLSQNSPSSQISKSASQISKLLSAGDSNPDFPANWITELQKTQPEKQIILGKPRPYNHLFDIQMIQADGDSYFTSFLAGVVTNRALSKQLQKQMKNYVKNEETDPIKKQQALYGIEVLSKLNDRKSNPKERMNALTNQYEVALPLVQVLRNMTFRYAMKHGNELYGEDEFGNRLTINNILQQFKFATNRDFDEESNQLGSYPQAPSIPLLALATGISIGILHHGADYEVLKSAPGSRPQLKGEVNLYREGFHFHTLVPHEEKAQKR